MLGHGDDTVDAAQTSLLGRQSLAHELDDQKRAADFDIRLSASGRSGRADGVVTVLTGADDGRISDAARDFPRPAAGSGYRRDFTVRVYCIHVARTRREFD